MIKLIITAVIFSTLLFVGIPGAQAASRVRGYYKPSTGRYVAPHYRTAPDTSKWNNYSTKGNLNPYTGKLGNKRGW